MIDVQRCGKHRTAFPVGGSCPLCAVVSVCTCDDAIPDSEDDCEAHGCSCPDYPVQCDRDCPQHGLQAIEDSKADYAYQVWRDK